MSQFGLTTLPLMIIYVHFFIFYVKSSSLEKEDRSCGIELDSTKTGGLKICYRHPCFFNFSKFPFSKGTYILFVPCVDQFCLVKTLAEVLSDFGAELWDLAILIQLYFPDLFKADLMIWPIIKGNRLIPIMMNQLVADGGTTFKTMATVGI